MLQNQLILMYSLLQVAVAAELIMVAAEVAAESLMQKVCPLQVAT